MISSNVENTVAAQKIQIRLIIHVVEVCAFRTRIDLVEPDYSLRLHQRRVYVTLVKLVILTQSRCDNFLQIKSHSLTFCDLRSKRKLMPHDFRRMETEIRAKEIPQDHAGSCRFQLRINFA